MSASSPSNRYLALEKGVTSFGCFAVAPLMLLLFLSPDGHWVNLVVGALCIAGGILSAILALRHWREHRRENPSRF